MSNVEQSTVAHNTEQILAEMFAYVINDCKANGDWFAKLFVRTGMASKLEKNHAANDKSGVEIADEIFKKTNQQKYITKAKKPDENSSAYWCGRVLAQYQKKSGRKYKDIFTYILLDDLQECFPAYAQMDDQSLFQALDKMYDEAQNRTNLKILREQKELSRAQLADCSGVNIRSIRLYEQRQVDINKAQAKTLYKLSQALGCRIEDILEKNAE